MAKEEQLLELIVRAAEDKKGLEIKVLDVSKVSSLFSFMVLVSAESSPQIKALTKEISFRVKKAGVKGHSWEGEINSGWSILDLGGIVVHVMNQKERAYYNIDELWGKEAKIYHY